MSHQQTLPETVRFNLNEFPEPVHAMAKMRSAILRKTLKKYIVDLIRDDCRQRSNSDDFNRGKVTDE